MIHSMSFAVVVDYYMYLDLEEVELDKTWKDEIFWLLDISWYNFQSDDLVQPNPLKYAGNSNMITATHNKQSTIERIKEAARGKRGSPSS